MLQGEQQANAKISALKLYHIQLIEEIEFIELFEDRALQCFYTLKKIMATPTDDLKLEFTNKKIKHLPGGRKRLMMESKSDWWQRVTVIAEPPSDDDANNGIKDITFYTATNGAREEKKHLQLNQALVANLLDTISTQAQWTPEIAKAIFELLIPNEFKENIRRQTDVLWVLDTVTAAYPWELFQTDIQHARPMCINAGMIRQLATADYKMNIVPVNSKNVLVIGDPLTEGFCNQLPGAEKEANEMVRVFGQYDSTIESVIKKNSSDVITSLFKQEYKIIHVSGHGNFDKEHPELSGMIIGNKVFLTPREFNQLSYTPELVFVNCCYLGKVDAAQENLYNSRYKFAANIGTQLIENGVRAVIAAGWAVDDAAAVDFATIFYQCMFNGYEFGKAVLQARQTIYERYPYTNTWGAFQCYGDPFYKLKIERKKAVRTFDYIIPQEAENDIENLVSKAQIAYYDEAELRAELDAILDAIYAFKVDTPDLLEKAAGAYKELNDYKKAIQLFRDVLKSEHASYTVSSLEKFNNILAKQLLSDYIEKPSAQAEYLAELEIVIGSLMKLLEIAETSERHSLIGSAYKRKARICSKRTDKMKALSLATYHYYLAHEKDTKKTAYSLANWIELEWVLNQVGVHKWGGMSKSPTVYKVPGLQQSKTKIEKCLHAIELVLETDSYDYWSLISHANLSLCAWLMKGTLENAEQDHIAAMYQRTWEFVGSKNKKMTEIEHFDLLLDFSLLAKNDRAHKTISDLKDDLIRSM